MRKLVCLLIGFVKVCDVVCGDECVNLKQIFGSTSTNIISRCVLGEKFEDENGKNRFGDDFGVTCSVFVLGISSLLLDGLI